MGKYPNTLLCGFLLPVEAWESRGKGTIIPQNIVVRVLGSSVIIGVEIGDFTVHDNNIVMTPDLVKNSKEKFREYSKDLKINNIYIHKVSNISIVMAEVLDYKLDLQLTN